MPLMLTSSTQENMQEKDVFLSILKTDILEKKKIITQTLKTE